MKKNITNYILDSFKILFRNKLLFGIGAINTLFLGFLALVSYGIRSGFLNVGIFIILVFTLCISIVFAFIMAGKLHVIKLVYQKEYALNNDIEVTNPKFADFFEGSKKFGANIWGGSLLLLVVFMFIFIPIFFIIQMISSVIVLGILEKLLFLIISIAMIFISLWNSILVVENIPVETAISRSISFSKRNFFTVLGINIFISIINFKNTLNLNLGFLSKGYELNSVIQIPIIHQYIFNVMGPISLPIIFVFLTLFDLISAMILMDLYLDRKDLQQPVLK